MFFFLEAIKGLNFNCRIVSYCKNQKKMHSPPFIFSRFQCGKQIHALKYLVLAGGKGRFLLIKNKLPRALRSPLFSLRLPRLLGAPDPSLEPWGTLPAVAKPPLHCEHCKASAATAPSPFGWGYQNICFSLKRDININKRLASASRFLLCFLNRNPLWGPLCGGLSTPGLTARSSLPP